MFITPEGNKMHMFGIVMNYKQSFKKIKVENQFIKAFSIESSTYNHQVCMVTHGHHTSTTCSPKPKKAEQAKMVRLKK